MTQSHTLSSTLAALLAVAAGLTAPGCEIDELIADEAQDESMSRTTSGLQLQVGPLQYGAQVHFDLAGAQPNQLVSLGGSTQFAACRVGTDDCLVDPLLLLDGQADPFGEASVSLGLPWATPPGDYYFQAVTAAPNRERSPIVMGSLVSPSCADDAWEDNETVATAADLTSELRTRTGFDGYIYLPMVACPGDLDWFTFYSNHDYELSVQIRNPGPVDSLRLQVRAPGGDWVDGGSEDRVYFSPAAVGDWKVRVIMVDQPSALGEPYEFQMDSYWWD